MSSDLFPLSINYGTIAAWLVERHKLPGDWLKRLQALQKKVSESAVELPPGFLSQVQGGDEYPLKYFAIKQIRDKLAETSDRGLFGRLAGSAGTWDKLVKAIEKSLVHLGEAGQTLSKNVDFEIPFLKRGVDTLDKQIADNEKKKGDYLKNASNSAAAFQKECNSLGIQGIDIRIEVTQYADSVFQHVQQGLDICKEAPIREAATFYRSFSDFVHGKATSEAELVFLTEIQNDQVEPLSITNEQEAKAAQETVQAPVQEDAMGPNIVTSVQAPEATAEEGGIDWDFDILDPTHEHEGGCDLPSDPIGEIDWDVEVDIEAEEAGNEDSSVSNDWELVDRQESCSVAVTGLGNVSKVATENSIVRIIWDIEFRNGLLDDLMELQSFLLTRQMGMENETSGIIGGQLLPIELQAVDGGAIIRMLDAVNGALSSLNGEKARQLILLKTSSRWLEKVTTDLEKKGGQEAKWRKSLAQLERKRKELQKSLIDNKLKLTALVKHTKMVKNCAEEAISNQFGGRKINIVGDLTGVL